MSKPDVIKFALRVASLAQVGLQRLDRRLEQLKMDLIIRQDIATEEELRKQMAEAGWLKPTEPGPVIQDHCSECGAVIPDEDGGSIVNAHHEVSCSLYDDHISVNSGV